MIKYFLANLPLGLFSTIANSLAVSIVNKYLLEFIQNIPKEKELVLEFMYANSAVKVYEKDNENYIYILMPLALRD